MSYTQKDFLDKMREVDSLCEIQFWIEVPMAVRIRPSHPRYRDALREQSELHRPIGLAVSIVKEVDDWNFPKPRPNWLTRMWERLFGIDPDEEL